MVFWSSLHWKFCQKALYLVVRFFSQKSKIVIPYKIFKQKCFPRNSSSKGFAKFRIHVSGEFHLQKSCRGQVFDFTEDRFRLVVPLETFETFQNSHFVDSYSQLQSLNSEYLMLYCLWIILSTLVIKHIEL